MGEFVVILGVFLQGYHLSSNRGITMERNRRILIMVALPLLFLSAILVATSGGWEIGEADPYTSEVGPTLIEVNEKTPGDGKRYLAKYKHDDLYYQLEFFIDGTDVNHVNYVPPKFETTTKYIVEFFTDADLKTKASEQDICLALPGDIQIKGNTYTVKYDKIVLDSNANNIRTVVFAGDPKINSDNTKPTLRKTTVTKVVFLGSPTFNDKYVLTKPVVDTDGTVNTTPLKNVVFKSHVDVVPSAFITKGGGSRETRGELNISFESSVGKIPQSMDAFTIFGETAPAALKSKLTYSFGASSSRPAEIEVLTDGWMDVSFVIDLKSNYWKEYIKDGNLADTTEGSLNQFIADGRLKVCGNPSHAITRTVSEGGAISLPERASFKQTVTVIPSPNEGYILGTLGISYGGKTSTVVGPSYSFEMPDMDVSISATFIKVIPLVVKATFSGSETSMDISVSGNQNGVSPASISAYVKYKGNTTGDRFVRMNVSIINYNGQFETKLVASMSAFTPVECLIQILSDSGDPLTQKVVVFESG